MFSQICGLEHSIRLQQLGVAVDSILWWADTRKGWKAFNCQPAKHPHDISIFIAFENDSGAGEIELIYGYDDAVRAINGNNDSKPLPAYTVAELGEILPLDIITTKVLGNECRWLCSQQDSEDGDTIWHEIDPDFSPEGFYADTEANARAKMLIYLLEQDLITID